MQKHITKDGSIAAQHSAHTISWWSKWNGPRYSSIRSSLMPEPALTHWVRRGRNLEVIAQRLKLDLVGPPGFDCSQVTQPEAQEPFAWLAPRWTLEDPVSLDAWNPKYLNFKPHVRDAPNSRFGPRGVVQIFPCSSKGRADCHSCGHQRGDISRNRHSQPANRGLGRLLSSGHHWNSGTRITGEWCSLLETALREASTLGRAHGNTLPHDFWRTKCFWHFTRGQAVCPSKRRAEWSKMLQMF